MGICISSNKSIPRTKSINITTPSQINTPYSNSTCINITCEKGKKGSYGCIYTLTPDEINIIRDILESRNVRFYYYTLTLNGIEEHEYLLDPDEQRREGQINSIISILSNNSIKVFHKINQNTYKRYNEELTNIGVILEKICDNNKEEFEKWTTYREVSLDGQPIYGYSFQPISGKASITIQNTTLKDTDKLYCIPQYKCGGDIISYLNDKRSYQGDTNFNFTNLQTDLLTFIKKLFAKGYVHRDIKLENIVYCKGLDNAFRFIDFGFLHKAGDLNYMEHIIGTPDYMSRPYLEKCLMKKIEYIKNNKTNVYETYKNTFEKIKLTPQGTIITREFKKLGIHPDNWLDSYIYATFYEKFFRRPRQAEINQLGFQYLMQNDLDMFDSIDTLFIGTAFKNYPDLVQLDYLNDIFALYITLNRFRRYYDPPEDTTFDVIKPLLENNADYMMPVQNGGKLQLQKTDKKIHLLGRDRVVYLGKHRKQYVCIKNEYIPVSSVKKK